VSEVSSALAQKKVNPEAEDSSVPAHNNMVKEAEDSSEPAQNKMVEEAPAMITAHLFSIADTEETMPKIKDQQVKARRSFLYIPGELVKVRNFYKKYGKLVKHWEGPFVVLDMPALNLVRLKNNPGTQLINPCISTSNVRRYYPRSTSEGEESDSDCETMPVFSAEKWMTEQPKESGDEKPPYLRSVDASVSVNEPIAKIDPEILPSEPILSPAGSPTTIEQQSEEPELHRSTLLRKAVQKYGELPPGLKVFGAKFMSLFDN